MNWFVYVLLFVFVAFAVYECASLIRAIIKRIKSRSAKKQDDVANLDEHLEEK